MRRPRVFEGRKPVQVETVVAELAVEALNERVLRRLAWLNEVQHRCCRRRSSSAALELESRSNSFARRWAEIEGSLGTKSSVVQVTQPRYVVATYLDRIFGGTVSRGLERSKKQLVQHRLCD
jgi:hypothetical protein